MYFTNWIVIGMRLKHAVVMLLPLLFMTFGTAYFTELSYGEVKVLGGVVTPMYIGLYWDEEYTNPVSCIDFGMIAKGQSRCVTFWLKNNSPDKGRVSWGSANFYPSSDGIAEHWERKVGRFTYISNWDKKIKTGDFWGIHYAIQVAQDTQVGMYSWDLIVEFIVPPKIYGLYVLCFLTVTQ